MAKKYTSKTARKSPAKKSTRTSTPTRTPASSSSLPRPSAFANRGYDGRDYQGVHGTKSPTGSRPVPVIAHNHPPEPTVPGPFRAAPYEQNPQPGRVTKHPTPNRDRLTGRPRSEGGSGSY